MNEARRVIPSATIEQQRLASSPGMSAWVRAHAGSGKTYVLAQRVLRLLLAGTDPARILCITYTKAAAAEMANRIFERLAEWTTMADAELAAALAGLGGQPPAAQDLARARGLFAHAIETPGRLRIQTIHAFCERLLQQFPFESSVTAGFEVIDERASAELLADARAHVLRATLRDPGGEAAGAVAGLVAHVGEEALTRLLGDVVRRKDALRLWLRRHDDDFGAALAELAGALGLAPGEDEEAVRRAILDEGVLPESEWAPVAATVAQGSASDIKAAGRLMAAVRAASPDERLAAYLQVFLTGEGTARKRLVTKAVSGPFPDLADLLQQEAARVAALGERLRAARVVSASGALFRFSGEVLSRYEALKATRGLMDYDDLVAAAAALLTRVDAAWVLYKLDGGLDHLLIDEAQDTSPGQWRIVEALTGEFFAGRGARDVTRTVFAVGDEKQSIYSFQGADPSRFAQMRRRFARRAEAAGTTLGDASLILSFRSVPGVLEAVDAVFATPLAAAGLHPEDAAEAVIHQAVRAAEPGLVEVWPVERDDPADPPAPWDAPFDATRRSSAQSRLAARIASQIRGWLDRGERLDATGRPIRPGDVLVLVRNRTPFAGEMVRALKEHGVPVAGADRMVLTAHIAVMDLMALGRFCWLPEDDLNLAALLKSPLLGLSEDDLMCLAIGRGGSLWDALRDAANAGGVLASAAERLGEWRRRAGFERPYEFYARILGDERGRAAFHRRLGGEAMEALDEFLAAALAHERAQTPTLPSFLSWLDASEGEVKRDMDKGRDEVRVMTVHGAKGLEAPIVFLPDTCRAPEGTSHGPLFVIGEGDDAVPVWVPNRGLDCPATADLREASREAARREENRLLYVAMTRARDRLYIAGYENRRDRPETCWYEKIASALAPRLQAADDGRGGEVRRLPETRTGAPAPRQDASGVPAEAALPDWIAARLPAETGEGRVAASGIGEEPAVRPVRGTAPAARRLAMRRGRLVHRLLESLPAVAPADRPRAASRALAILAPDWSEEDRTRLVEQVMAMLQDEAFAAAFGPGARAELDVAGRIEGIAGTVMGRIDLLADTEDARLLVDYKTDRNVPVSVADVPAGYLRQLAAYRALVAGEARGRPVRCAILWTAGPRLMDVTVYLPELRAVPAGT